MESGMKKRLQSFLGDMVRFGTVSGFKYFSTYVRGREEMVISILNEPEVILAHQNADSLISSVKTDFNNSLTSQHLPYDKRSLMLSQRTQLSLSGHADKGVGLPPASPSDHETHPMDEGCTVFLIAGYTRYSCPYVWVRSNHDRLVRLTREEAKEKDNPLRLKSTTRWKDNEVYIWDVVAELVKLCTYPTPWNPFEVDFSLLCSLSSTQQVLATSSMAQLLQTILLHSSEEKNYTVKVFEDLQMVMRHHYLALQELARENSLSVLQKQPQMSAATTGHMRRTYKYSY